MIRRRKSATIALVIAACCLPACGAPKVAPTAAPTSSAAATSDRAAAYRTAANRGEGPRVSEITVREGRLLAAAWCSDLAAADKATAMAKINAEAPSLDAINVALFALESVCPELDAKAAS